MRGTIVSLCCFYLLFEIFFSVTVLAGAIEGAIPFLTPSDYAEAINISDTLENGFSPPIYFPSSLPLGSSNSSMAFVNINGFISFNTNEILNSHIPTTLSNDSSSSPPLIAPYWDHIKEGTGHIKYWLVEYSHTNTTNNDILQQVNDFVSVNQSLLSDFNASWLLVVQWSDVCPFHEGNGSQSCAPGIKSNSFQAIITTNGSLSLTIFTYKCGSINWSNGRTVVGYSVGPHYIYQHPWSMSEAITNIDCVDSQSINQWSSLLYLLSEVTPSAVLISSSQTKYVLLYTSTNITCSVQGNPLPTVIWYKNNKQLLGSSTVNTKLSTFSSIVTLIMSNLTADDYGSYNCRGVSVAGTTSSNSVRLLKAYPVQLEPPSRNRYEIEVTHSISLRCKAQGAPRPKVTWRAPNGINITNNYNNRISIDETSISTDGQTQVQSTLSFSNLTFEMHGTYTCVAYNEVENNGSFVRSAPYPLIVEGVPEFTYISSPIAIITKPFALTFNIRSIPPTAPHLTTWTFTNVNGITTHLTCTNSMSSHCSFSGKKLTLYLHNVTLADQGHYTIQAINLYGTGRQKIYLLAQAPPNITMHPPETNKYVLLGHNITINCITTGYPQPNITWIIRNNFTSLPSTINTINTLTQLDSGLYRVASSLNLRNVDLNFTGRYSCVGRNFANVRIGNVATANFTLEVQVPLHDMNMHIPDVQVTHSNISLTCTASGLPAPSLNWYKNGVRLYGNQRVSIQFVTMGMKSSSVLLISNAQVSNKGNYMCLAKRNAALGKNERSLSSVMNIYDPVVLVQRLPHSLNILKHDNLMITCSARGYPKPLIQWMLYNGSGNIANITTNPIKGYSISHSTQLLQNDSLLEISNLTITNASTRHSGRYICTVINSLNSSYQYYNGVNTSLMLSVWVPPTVYFPNGPNELALKGSSITLYYTITNTIPPITSIQWTHNNNSLDINSDKFTLHSNGLTIHDITYTDEGLYEVTVMGQSGQDSTTLNLTIEAAPNITRPLPYTQVLLAGSNATFNCTVEAIPAFTITWYYNGQMITNNNNNNNNTKYRFYRNAYSAKLVVMSMSLADAGTYECVVFNRHGNDSSSSRLQIQIPPSLSVNNTIITAIHRRDPVLDNTTIHVNITASHPPIQFNNVHWSILRHGVGQPVTIVPTGRYHIIIGGDYVRLVIMGVVYSDGGMYTVSVSNPAGRANVSVYLNVTVEAHVKVIGNTKVNKLEHQSTTLTCIADGIPLPNDIHWFRNGSLLDPDLQKRINITSTRVLGYRTNISVGILGLRSSLIIPDPLYSVDNGYYYCRTSNGQGTPAVIVKPFALSITSVQQDFCSIHRCNNGGSCVKTKCLCAERFTGRFCEIESPSLKPASISIPPSDIIGDLYGNIVLTCNVSGNPQPSVIWYKDGLIITDQDQNDYTFVIYELGLSHRGFYQCQAVNSIRGVVHTSNRSIPAVVNIKGIVQYQVLLFLPTYSIQTTYNTTQLQQYIDKINDIVAGKILTGGTELFFIELLPNSKYNATSNSVPVLITVITQERGSYELLTKVRGRLQELNIGFKSNDTFHRFDGCTSNKQIIPAQNGDSKLDITLTWPETNIGDYAIVKCPCSGVDLGEGTLEARRYCGGDFVNGSKWQEGNVAACNFTDRARKICQLADLPANELVEELMHENISDFKATEISVLTSVLVSAQDGVYGNENASDGLFNIVDNIAGLDRSLLLETLEQSNTPARLLSGLESVTNRFPLPQEDNDTPVQKNYNSFVIQIQKINPETYEGQTFEYSNEGLSRKRNLLDSVQPLGSITLPSGLFREVSSNKKDLDNSTLAASSILFKKDSLFLTNRKDYSVSSTVVISATLLSNGSQVMVKDLSKPIMIKLKKPIQPPDSNITTSCVYWQATSGSWSDEGCSLVNETDDSIICECNHLTNFAAILDASPNPTVTPISSAVGKALNALSYIGIIVSIFCLIVTVVTYLQSRKLKRSDHGQLLLNLCFALLGVYFSFILALHSPPAEPLCAMAGAILQYFLLVTFFVMAGEALNLYIKLVIVLGKGISRYVIKVTLLSWITPIFIVVFCFAPNYKLYAGERFCRAIDMPFYIGTLIPFIIIYIFNWIMFILIMAQLIKKKCSKKFNESKSKETGMSLFQQFMIALTLSILFGLGWGIGLPASGAIFETAAIRDTFAAAFILLTGFQGLFIFLMHCVRSAEARKEWKTWLFKLTGSKRFETFSSMANSSVIQRRTQRKSETSITKGSYISKPDSPISPVMYEEDFAIDDKVVEMSTIQKELSSPVHSCKTSNKDVVFPVPDDIELKKAKEIFPSEINLQHSLSMPCVNFENPLEISVLDPTTPFSPSRSDRFLDNPLNSSNTCGVINEENV